MNAFSVKEIQGDKQDASSKENPLKFERLLFDISNQLIQLPTDQIGKAIEQGLERAVQFLGVDRGSVYEYTDEKKQVLLTYSWTVDPAFQSPLLIESERLPYIHESVLKGKMVLIARLTDLPDSLGQDRQSLAEMGVQSTLIVPLVVGGTILGAVGFTSLHKEWRGSEDTLQRLRLIGEVFANAIARKRYEEKLSDAAVNYRMVADFTYDWEYWANRDGTLRYISPSCERISGFSAEEFRKRPSLLREIILAEDQEGWNQHLFEARRHLQPYEILFRIRRKDGRVRWIEHTCQPVRGGRGEFLGYRASNRDVTERKQAEASLQQSEQDLRRLSSQLISAQEEERKRIARELHDGIGQSLSAIKFVVDNVLLQVNAKPDDPNPQALENVVPLIQNTIAEVRRLQTDLRPSILDDLGILATLSWFCREYQRIYTGIEVEQRIELLEQDVPEDLKTVIYRILQEAMNNVAKHSRATRVRLSLRKQGNVLLLVVEDNGAGFDLLKVFRPCPGERGFGLTSMKERAELSGGSLWIESKPGEGTHLRATWPISAECPGETK